MTSSARTSCILVSKRHAVNHLATIGCHNFNNNQAGFPAEGGLMNSSHTVSRIRLDGGAAERRALSKEEPTEGLAEELDNVMRLLKQPSFSPRSQVKDRS